MSSEQRPISPTQPESSTSLLSDSELQPGSSINEETSQIIRPHPRLVMSASTPTPAAFYHGDLEIGSNLQEGWPPRPKLKRMSSVRNAMSVVAKSATRTASFFGAVPRSESPESTKKVEEERLKWTRRRLRMINRKYGGINDEVAQKALGTDEENPFVVDATMEVATPTTILGLPFTFIMEEQKQFTPVFPEGVPSFSRSVSVDSTGKQRFVRRESIPKMAWDSVSHFVQRGSTRPVLQRQSSTTSVKRDRSSSMSFNPLVVQPVKSDSRRSSLSCRVGASPGIEPPLGVLGSPGSSFFRRFASSERELGSADSRRSGKTGYEAIQMSKIEEEEPEILARKQSTGQRSDVAMSASAFDETSGGAKRSGFPAYFQSTEVSNLPEPGPSTLLELPESPIKAEEPGASRLSPQPGSPRIAEQAETAAVGEVSGPSRGVEEAIHQGYGEQQEQFIFGDRRLSDISDTMTIEEFIHSKQMDGSVYQVYPMKMNSFTEMTEKQKERKRKREEKEKKPRMESESFVYQSKVVKKEEREEKEFVRTKGMDQQSTADEVVTYSTHQFESAVGGIIGSTAEAEYGVQPPHLLQREGSITDTVSDSVSILRGDTRFDFSEHLENTYFGVDRVSLLAEEELDGSDVDAFASPTSSFDKQFSASVITEVKRVQPPRSYATSTATFMPNPFVFPKAPETTVQEPLQKSRLIERVLPVKEDELPSFPENVPPLERPTSLGLTQAGKLKLQRWKAIDAAHSEFTERHRLLEKLEIEAKQKPKAGAGILKRQDAFDAGITPLSAEFSHKTVESSHTAAGPSSIIEGEQARSLQVEQPLAGDAGLQEPSAFMQRIKHIKKIFRTRGPRQPKSRFHGVGFGVWRQFFRRRLNQVDHSTADRIESFEDHRPFFTYYVSSVQLLVCLMSIFFYGFSRVGFDMVENSATVLHTSVVLRQVSILEAQNFWLGPRFSDLVHLGAKYSPCMRRDKQTYAVIEKERRLENKTGCCVYNDGVGCFQASQHECPNLLASLIKWTPDRRGPHGRISGAVCGQDPGYCEDPASVQPYVWPDDITKWPICHSRAPHVPEDQKHLQCEITGRPCCILLTGQCRVTTREYCDFVQGYYHPNATLCSQVSCLKEVCGMLPFLHEDRPDQFYRLFFSLFLHAGLLHCIFTFLVHWFYMRDVEKLIGWARMAVLYLGSGIGGNLTSALLMPYKPEVGPSGALIGIFAAMYADVYYNWELIAHPWNAIKELLAFTIFMFCIGILPWIDNWAHFGGFIFGFFISLAVFPYIEFGGKFNSRKRRITQVICCAAIFLIFALLTYAFYWWPPMQHWDWISLFNCVPIVYTHMCDDQGVTLKEWIGI